MRSRSTLGTVAVLTGALAATALVYAPTAGAAVAPGSATATYDCSPYNTGSATLTATHSGTTLTINITTSVTTPIALGADTINATLKLANSTGPVRSFTGKKNPAIPANGAVKIGPITGTVAVGDKLNSYFAGTALSMVVMGITINCDAVTSQSPGPFVIS
ncbi:hypothetical protein [Streptomyces sp. NPDC056144]|uniref:hypothetical protein n=1 Tax=unclassified Streptomyces TaxID=2593676 RepID=UPI0035DD795F